MNAGKSPWTDDLVEHLKALAVAGELSCSQMAAELGSGVTRNSVIGKLNRLGLKAATRLAVRSGPKPGGQRRAHRRSAVIRKLFRAPSITADYARDLPPEQPSPERQCSLMELTDATCRFPIGDPGASDFFFCGGKPVGDLPYCAYHARMAYQPAHGGPGYVRPASSRSGQFVRLGFRKAG